MRPIGNGQPNSGTNARASDLAGKATEARLKALHERGSGKAAINRELKTGVGAARRVPVERKGAGRLARAKD
jgi:hypothetical protein